MTNLAVYERIFDICEITVRCITCTKIPDTAIGVFGDGYLDGIYEDVLFLSPSVRRDTPEILRAIERGTIVTSECEIFFHDARDEGRQIFAITGSDGKTTVTRMASQMLSAVAVGNIGVPYSTREEAKPNAVGEGPFTQARYVAELSSFNLFGFKPKSDASVITSLSPNHLNWHTDLSEYYFAKLGIFENTGRAVMYAGGDCMKFVSQADTLFSDSMTKGELSSLGARHTIYVSCGVIFYDDEPILPVCELSLRERYNVLNFMAAVGLCFGYAEIEKMKEVGRGFTPPKHRCEKVHTAKDGTVFIDSSIDTTPTRTATTLSGLKGPVFLIIGGSGKGLSPSPLKEPISRQVRGILAYGDFGRELCDFLSSDKSLSNVYAVYEKRLSDGLCVLKSHIRSGETVILSPAATAFGEFENYEKRGDFFAQYVRKEFP